MSKFIMVKSKEDRQELKKMGLQEINKTHEAYFFLNEPEKLRFNKGKIKLTYTNKLMF